jgi:hypothetical protein
MAVLNKLNVPVASGENLGTLMPKLQYRFRVNFTDLGPENTVFATQNVVSVTRPNMSHEEVTIDTYNSKIYLAGKHSWEPITVELRDDVNSETSKIMDNQVAKQIDMLNQSSPKAAASYKFEMEIENLSGGNPEPEVLDTWLLSGCYISNLQYGDTNYASGGEFQSLTVQIRFDTAAHYTGSDRAADMLSNPTFSPADTNTVSGSTT